MPKTPPEQTVEPIEQSLQLAPALAPPGPKPPARKVAEPGGVYALFRNSLAASDGQEPPPEQLSALLQRPEVAHPANDVPRMRVLGDLQQRFGNRYVQRVVAANAPAQTDAAAYPPVQRQPANAPAADGAAPVPPLALNQGGGEPLDEGTHSYMAARFGRNFDDVRIHNDNRAQETAKDLNAEAFTTGRDIYFGRGAYQPTQESGRGLLAHELTHVVQQDQGTMRANLRTVGNAHVSHTLSPTMQSKLTVGDTNDIYEQEADRVANAVVDGAGPDHYGKPHTSPVGQISRLQRAAVSRWSGGTLTEVDDAGLRSRIESPEEGHPLAAGLRQKMELGLGANFSAVRVHDSARDQTDASNLNAAAFTSGNHIWLGPGSSAGETKLMAHELTHVVQQNGDTGPMEDSDRPPAIQRTPDNSSSVLAAPPTTITSGTLSSMATSTSSSIGDEPATTSELTSSQSAGGTDALSPQGADGTDTARSAANEGDSSSAGAQAEANQPDAAPVGQAEAPRSAGTAATDSGEAITTADGEFTIEGILTTPETHAGELQTGVLVLIDVELAEHQRWAGALGRVGEVASLHRAEFVAEAVGSGFISGAASGLGMGLAMGLVTRAVPAIGPIIGGGMALHGLITRDWAETGATIGRFGQGSDTYETLANTIASVAAVIDVVSQILNVINGIVGVVQVAAIAITGGATVAAFFTFGATAGIAIAAGEVAATCMEISEGIGVVTMVLDTVNSAILQPCVTLFRALHAFTTQADPREVEAQGRGISSAAAASGAALGAWAGGKAAQAGGRARPPAEEVPPSQRPAHETPPPAAGEGPVVHFQEPVTSAAHGEGTPLPVAHAEAAPPPIAHAETAPPPAAHPETVPPPAAHAETARPVAVPVEATAAPAAAVAAPAPIDVAASAGGGGAPGGGGGGAPPVDYALTGRRPEPGGIVIHEFGRPGVDTLEHLDIEATVAALDPHAPAGGRATSDTFFELPAGRDTAPGVLPAHGLQDFDIRMNPDPARIQYHENMTFEGVTHARIAEHGTIVPGERGTQVGAPGVPHTEGSVLPDDVARVTTSPVPVRGPASPRAGEPWPVEVRTHSANPDPNLAAVAPHAHSRFNPTTQVNTSRGQYLLPDGRWVSLGHPDIGAGHYPVGGRDRGLLGLGEIPGTPGGVPTPPGPGPGPGGGGGTPPVVPAPPPAPAAAAPPAVTMHTAPEGPVLPPSSSTGGGGGTPPPAPQRILVVGAERPEEFRYAREVAARGHEVTVVNPQATPESATFAAEGGNFVQAGIETLPQQPLYNVVSEDFPVPIRRMFPQAQAFASERITRLEPGGRWVVATESAEFVQMLQLVGGMQGVRVTSHEVPRYHEATPDSPHVVEPTRYIVTVERPNAPTVPPSPSESGPPSTPPPVAPPVDTTASSIAASTITPPPTSVAPQATASSTVSTWSAARGAAQSAAPLTPGGPQPGTESPTGWGTRAHQVGELFLPQVFGSGGEAPTYAQQQAAHRARFTADNQPAEGVERVNPNYPPPPATPAQITAVQNEIVNLLATRARAEQESQHQSERADRCEANQEPIQQTVEDTSAGISAVQAHNEAIARRQAVNQEQQQRQQEAQGLTAGYPSRATGLTALTVPLAAWEGFTSLASHLPGAAGDKMLRMNQEAQQMQQAFAQMGAEMLGVDNTGPARAAELQGDQGRLEATGDQAQSSDQDLHTASAGAAGLQNANEAALAEAARARDTAAEQAQQLGDAAAQREEHADSLAEQLGVWAEAHKSARDQAIQATERRLQAEGKINVRSTER